MNISTANLASPVVVADAGKTATEGVRSEERRFERNVEEVSKSQITNTQNAGQRDKALVEQTEIANAVQANVRSLEVANQRAGTLIDIKV